MAGVGILFPCAQFTCGCQKYEREIPPHIRRGTYLKGRGRLHGGGYLLDCLQYALQRGGRKRVPRTFPCIWY